jgi:alpha-L-fucosidase
MPMTERQWMLPALATSIVVLSSALTLGVGQTGSAPAAAAVAPPAPYGTLPSERQVRWHELETYAFLHFTTNTFTDKEWGYGDEQPSIFNPTAFDADKIVTALKAAGMRGVILTAKHHDGFCLWPTKTTKHSVASSSWKNGQGDVVKELAEAARKQGLEFGVYLSPWDRNHPQYGQREYVQVYRAQLRELLSNYGPIFEVWHDGANGGDGYYGGAREKRTIDRRTYYEWPTTWAIVRKLQPNAVIFSDVGPDVRWIGNEKGIAGDTSWATFSPVGPDGGAAAPGFIKEAESPVGHRDGSQWIPAECDVSIRPGWFWHAAESSKVKTAAQLVDLYYQSVGRGCSLLLNVPPDRRGLLDANDIASLARFGEVMNATFKTDLAANATLIPSNVRGGKTTAGAGPFAARNLIDGDRGTYWATDDNVKTPELIVDFNGSKTFSVVRLRENIRLGQRIEAFALDAWTGGDWKEFATATSIGPSRLIRLATPLTTSRLRLRITKAPVAPALAEFGVYLEPQSR